MKRNLRIIYRVICYVLFAGIFLYTSGLLPRLAIVGGEWHALGGTVWHIRETMGLVAFRLLSALGWFFVWISLMLINPQNLFASSGFRSLIEKHRQTILGKRLSGLMQNPRRLLYPGCYFALWSTPVMGVLQLILAGVSTVCILTSIFLEEPDVRELSRRICTDPGHEAQKG